jgi:hypothetical protein
MGLHMPLEQYLYSSIVCRTTCYEQNDGQHLSGYHLQGIPVRNHPQGWGFSLLQYLRTTSKTYDVQKFRG